MRLGKEQATGYVEDTGESAVSSVAETMIAEVQPVLAEQSAPAVH
jgi:hypothetical protein